MAMYRITSSHIDALRTQGSDQYTIDEAVEWLRISSDADRLITVVEEAFRGINLGDGVGLLESDGIDNYASAKELKRLRGKDEKRDWRQIPVERLEHCNAAPSFLDARGMLFHLPAFLCAELRGESEVEVIDRIVLGNIAAKGYIDLLTVAQKAAVVKCLQLAALCPGNETFRKRFDRAIAAFSDTNGS